MGSLSHEVYILKIVMSYIKFQHVQIIFIYRKSPFGESRYVWGRLVQGWMTVLPMATVYSIVVVMLVPGIDAFTFLGTIGFVVLYVTAAVMFALGVFLMFPVFSDKPSELMLNAMAVLMVSIFLFIFLEILIGGPWNLPLMIVMYWAIAATALSVGKKRLLNLE